MLKIYFKEFEFMDFMETYKKELVYKFQTMLKKDRKKMAMMSMERQFKSYVDFAINKSWNRVKDYRIILDECWKCIFSDTNLGEHIWEIHENIRPENVEKSIKENMELNISYANIFACNISELIDNLIDNMEYEEGFLLLNIGYIISYLNENNIEEKFKIDEYKEYNLVKNEIKNQKADLRNKDSIIDYITMQEWIRNCRNLLIL